MDSDSSLSSTAWDNFHDRSSYELGDHEFWSSREAHKIPIVSTDLSDLESPFTSSSESLNSVHSQINMAPSEACTLASKELVKAHNILKARVSMLETDDIDTRGLYSCR